MSIANTDLILYAAANTPEDDVATAGGAIDPLRRIDFTQLAANDDVEAVSDNAADTMNLTIYARNPAGAIVSEVKALTGTTAIIFSTIGVVERVLKAELASAPTGIITIRRSIGGATIRTIPAGERGFEIAFYDSKSETAGTDRYQKVFYKNAHGSLTLNAAKVALTGDPEAVMTFAVANAKNDSETSANRKTAPSAVGAFSDAQKDVPGTTLEAGSVIGIWMKMTLTGSHAPLKSTFTLELTGTSV